MPKGRTFVPNGVRDGIWFQHIGTEHMGQSLKREEATTSGIMNATRDFPYTSIPAATSVTFNARSLKNYKSDNPFSEHDNRHSFQDHGVYLEDGRDERLLGRHLTERQNRQHNTSKDFLKHHSGKNEVNFFYGTNSALSYKGYPCNDPPTRRRFPRNHRDPKPGPSELSTSTTLWHSPSPYKESIKTLANSQVPYSKHNVWKYSNHGLTRAYPIIDRLRKSRCDICTVEPFGH